MGTTQGSSQVSLTPKSGAEEMREMSCGRLLDSPVPTPAFPLTPGRSAARLAATV
jgi:hypothetical protein